MESNKENIVKTAFDIYCNMVYGREYPFTVNNLRMFFNEIGVRYNRDKKERMIESEVENDEQMLLLNINDMLKQRKKACDEINMIFNRNISVKLSPEFKIIERKR